MEKNPKTETLEEIQKANRKPQLNSWLLGLAAAVALTLVALPLLTPKADAALDTPGAFCIQGIYAEGGQKGLAGGTACQIAEKPENPGTDPGTELPEIEGQWLSCRGPQSVNGYANSVGGDFQVAQVLYRDPTSQLTNFQIYRTVNGITQTQLWSENPTRDLATPSSYSYLLHEHGSEFHNLPADNSAVEMYVRPVFAEGALGTKSNTITIYPNADLTQSFCITN